MIFWSWFALSRMVRGCFHFCVLYWFAQIELTHSIVNLCPVFYLMAYLQCTEPCRKQPDGLCVTSLLLGDNRQHRQVCAKTISYWVRKVLYVAKAYMSLGMLLGVAASAALVAGVSLVSIM